MGRKPTRRWRGSAGRIGQVIGFVGGLGGRGDADRIGEEILSALRKPFDLDGRLHHFETRIGVAVLDDQQAVGSALLDASVLTLDETDESTPFLTFSGRMQRRHDRQAMLKRDLRLALTGDALNVAYQPVFGLSPKKLVGLETYVRWEHPSEGTIPPREFLRLAEKTDMIYSIGQHVLSLAMDAAARWASAGLLGDLTLWVNFLPSEVLHHDFRNLVRRHLEQTPAVSLGIDLTEGSATSERAVSDTIRALALDDVRSAVDNFGGDFSTLLGLVKLPFDTIKLSGDLVRSLESNADHLKVVGLTTELAHSHGLAVVGAGVETIEQLQLLGQLGVDAVQGHFLALPAPEQEIADSLCTGEWPGLDGLASIIT